MRIVLFRPVDALTRRFQEYSVLRTGYSLSDHVLRLVLHRKSLPW